MVSMQGPPVYRIINIKSCAKEEILDRLSGCDFYHNPYIIDIIESQENQIKVLELLELYFSKKFARELRLYPLYVMSTESLATANFYVVREIDEIGKHFKQREKKNLSAPEGAKLKLYQSGLDHFNSIPPKNKKGILHAYTNKRKELWQELQTNEYLIQLANKL